VWICFNLVKAGSFFFARDRASQILNIKNRDNRFFEGEVRLIELIEPETALAFQSVFLVVLFVSMAFRMKGNYLVHGIIMIVQLAVGWVIFIAVIPGYMDSSFMQTYMNPSSTLVAFILHTVLGVAPLIFGTWLVALWRPRSTEFAAKSKKIWQLTVIFWVSAYVVGVLLFVALRPTFFA